MIERIRDFSLSGVQLNTSTGITISNTYHFLYKWLLVLFPRITILINSTASAITLACYQWMLCSLLARSPRPKLPCHVPHRRREAYYMASSQSRKDHSKVNNLETERALEAIDTPVVCNSTSTSVFSKVITNVIVNIEAAAGEVDDSSHITS